MRGLFVLLMMLNAGYFIWQYSMQKSSEAHSPTALALPPDSGIKSLVLLREAGLLTPKNTTAPKNTVQQPPPAPTASCYTIGPFMTGPDAQRASVMLETEELTVHSRTDGTLDNPEHWIDIGNNTTSPPAPVSEALWQTLISQFADIRQQPRVCQ